MTAVPALRGLKRAYPDRRLVLATTTAMAPLVDTFPFVDDMIEAQPLAPVPVRFDDDDVVVNLHGRGPESSRILLDAGARRLVAFSHPDVPATFGAPRWERGEHEVHRWCRLLNGLGIDARPDDIDVDPPVAATHRLSGATVIHPGAGAPARRWPPAKWEALARRLQAGGHTVVVTGGPTEAGLAHTIARNAGIPDDRVLAGDTSVRELADVIASAGCLVVSDTGPAHLASAYGTPSVVMFGPTAPSEWGPPERAIHRVLWAGPHGDPNGSTPHPGLAAIGVDDVVDAVVASRTALDSNNRPRLEGSSASL